MEVDSEIGTDTEIKTKEDNVVKLQTGDSKNIKAEEVSLYDNRVDNGVPLWALILLGTLIGLIIPSPFKLVGFKR